MYNVNLEVHLIIYEYNDICNHYKTRIFEDLPIFQYRYIIEDF